MSTRENIRLIARTPLAAYYSFFDYFSDYLNTINHSNFKLFIFVGILQVLKFEFLKFRILESLNFHPCKKL